MRVVASKGDSEARVAPPMLLPRVGTPLNTSILHFTAEYFIFDLLGNDSIQSKQDLSRRAL
jgi:hypothetical protein